MNAILKFEPIFKSVIWGGQRIARFKGIAPQGDHVGESWELSPMEGNESVVAEGPFKGIGLNSLIADHGDEIMGARLMKACGGRFPLLIKFIDSTDDLSVQVHPDDTLARARHNSPGKTEMWHIIDTDPDARIYSGLNTAITPDEYERRVADNTIMDVIAAYDSASGQTYFLPAGRIHAIGAGNLLAEIQQTSDITYRIYDYDRRDKDGNPRELHTDQAKDAIDYTVYPDYQSHPEGDLLAQCQYFDTRRLSLNSSDTPEPIANPRGSFTIIMCLDGQAEIIDNTDGRSFPVTRGETLLFPAVMTSLSARGTATLLSVQA